MMRTCKGDPKIERQGRKELHASELYQQHKSSGIPLGILQNAQRLLAAQLTGADLRNAIAAMMYRCYQSGHRNGRALQRARIKTA